MTAAGSTSYTYTPWGSLTSATTPSQTITYTPDALNRTTTRAVQGGQTTTYTYDGTSNTTTSQQVGSGTPTYYAPGLSAPLAQQNGTTTRFYQQDIHGDLTLFTDASGNPTASIRYDPWGTPTTLGSDATNSLLSYQSQPTDPTTGLVQMGARAYNPSLGQFTTQDSYSGTPSDPLTLNQYIYAGDSPIDNPDLNGHRFACTSTCTAAQSVLNNGIYDAGQAINRGDPLAAVGYVAQAVTWLKQAAAAPVPKPAATKPILMPGGLTHCAVCIQSSSYQLGNWNQEMTVAARGPSLLQTGILALGIVLTPITDGGSDVVAGELDAALAVDEAATAETASSGGVGETAFRVWGRDYGSADQLESQSGPWGQSWTRVDPRTIPDYRGLAGLPNDANMGRFLRIGRLVDNTGVEATLASRIGANAGGLDELVVPNPEAQIELHQVMGLNPAL